MHTAFIQTELTHRYCGISKGSQPCEVTQVAAPPPFMPPSMGASHGQQPMTHQGGTSTFSNPLPQTPPAPPSPTPPPQPKGPPANINITTADVSKVTSSEFSLPFLGPDPTADVVAITKSLDCGRRYVEGRQGLPYPLDWMLHTAELRHGFRRPIQGFFWAKLERVSATLPPPHGGTAQRTVLQWLTVLSVEYPGAGRRASDGEDAEVGLRPVRRGGSGAQKTGARRHQQVHPTAEGSPAPIL